MTIRETVTVALSMGSTVTLNGLGHRIGQPVVQSTDLLTADNTMLTADDIVTTADTEVT